MDEDIARPHQIHDHHLAARSRRCCCAPDYAVIGPIRNDIVPVCINGNACWRVELVKTRTRTTCSRDRNASVRVHSRTALNAVVGPIRYDEVAISIDGGCGWMIQLLSSRSTATEPTHRGARRSWEGTGAQLHSVVPTVCDQQVSVDVHLHRDRRVQVNGAVTRLPCAHHSCASGFTRSRASLHTVVVPVNDQVVASGNEEPHETRQQDDRHRWFPQN